VGLDSTDFALMSNSQLRALSTDDIVAMSANDIANLNADQISALTTTQVRAIESADIGALSAGDLQEFTTSQIRSLTAQQFNALATDDLQALQPQQFAALTTQHIRLMETTDIQALTNDQIGALTGTQAAALTTSQIHALSHDQVGSLTVGAISSMSMTQALAFTTDDTAAMSAQQLSALNALSPVVLDLDGNGVQTISSTQGVQFDLAATGHTGQYGWVGGNDGLLVRDINRDGVINDGSELFGVGTRLADGSRAGNGYAAMAALDSNHDGKLDARDAAFGELKVWVDANHDGVTNIGELRGLVEVGVHSLNLAHTASDRVDHGNAVALVGSYTTEDGATHEMADVWFAKARSETPPQIGDLLAAPSADLSLPGHAASTTAGDSSTTVATAAVVHKPNLYEEELLKNQPLI
jgi:hypothetical protein